MGKKVALIFPTIVEMTDFELSIETINYFSDRHSLTLEGHFQEREIELAINAYHAKMINLEE